jgi:hypothetical protein
MSADLFALMVRAFVAGQASDGPNSIAGNASCALQHTSPSPRPSRGEGRQQALNKRPPLTLALSPLSAGMGRGNPRGSIARKSSRFCCGLRELHYPPQQRGIRGGEKWLAGLPKFS